MKRIGGMFANLPTPFSRDGSRIDFAVVRERIEWLVEAGIHGFSTQLSAGEFAYLGLGERRSLTQVVMEAVNWRAPVLVGISGNSLAESTELARHAGELGATAAMLMPRSYFKLTEDEVLAYYDPSATRPDARSGSTTTRSRRGWTFPPTCTRASRASATSW